jgi:hypothetical protein
MNDLITWRLVCRYLILGLVFVPALALWLHDTPSPGRPGVDGGRISIAHDGGGDRLHVR